MPKIRVSAWSGSGEGPLLAANFLYSHQAEGSQEPCGVFFIKTLMPFRRVPTSLPKCLPKVLPPNTIIYALEF